MKQPAVVLGWISTKNELLFFRDDRQPGSDEPGAAAFGAERLLRPPSDKAHEVQEGQLAQLPGLQAREARLGLLRTPGVSVRWSPFPSCLRESCGAAGSSHFTCWSFKVEKIYRFNMVCSEYMCFLPAVTLCVWRSTRGREGSGWGRRGLRQRQKLHDEKILWLCFLVYTPAVVHIKTILIKLYITRSLFFYTVCEYPKSKKKLNPAWLSTWKSATACHFSSIIQRY